MRHQKANRKFGRKRNQRNALLKSLAGALVLKEKIRTTEAKAKSLRPFLEKLITKSKNNNLATRRLVSSRVGLQSGKKLIEIIGPKYAKRKGGYLRITRLPRRTGDGSKMAQIELI